METDEGFPVLDVSLWDALTDEPMGSKAKQWLVDPAGAAWLFKLVREAEDMRRGAREFGEDWAEKVASGIAAQLGVPVAQVELASRHGRRGLISRSVLPGHRYDLVGHVLIHGNELLQRLDPAYDKTQTREAVGYTLDAVWEVLAEFAPPPGVDDVLSSAPEVFAGFLVFDALIANTDRHHENWAVIQPAEGAAWLSPSFDHATCLGFQEPHDRKMELLDNPTVLHRWVERGSSNHFEGRPGLVELAVDGIHRCRSEIRRYWRNRLASLSRETWETTIGYVPDLLMSQADRTFASAVIGLNRERLLDADWRS